MFCEEGQPGQGDSGMWSGGRAGTPTTAVLFQVVSRSEDVGGLSVRCHVACPPGLDLAEGKLGPWTFAAVLV